MNLFYFGSNFVFHTLLNLSSLMLKAAFWFELDVSKGRKVDSSVLNFVFIAKLKMPIHPRMIHIMFQPNMGVIKMFMKTPLSDDKPNATKKRELQVMPCLKRL